MGPMNSPKLGEQSHRAGVQSGDGAGNNCSSIRVLPQRGDPYLCTTVSAGAHLRGRAGDEDKK